MKNLFGVFFCLFAAVAVQQAGESKSPGPPAPPSIQPSEQPSGQPASDVLVRALLAAEKAQNKQEKLPAEELKTMIDREIAKSATQVTDSGESLRIQANDLMVIIDGAVYLKFGGTIYPMPGGGASGCFDPNSAAKLDQARLKFAEQNKSAPGKKE